MDEAGIMEGLGVNGLVVGAAELRKAHLKEPNRGNWMTFIECISAEGEALDPLVIFRGKSVQQQWFPNESLENFQDWSFTASENGWTSNELAVEWLTKLFIPRTQPEDKNQYRLLVLDGHGSHITDEFMYTCFKNNVYLLFLPAHTSHILQPLDLSFFFIPSRRLIESMHKGYMSKPMLPYSASLAFFLVFALQELMP